MTSFQMSELRISNDSTKIKRSAKNNKELHTSNQNELEQQNHLSKLQQQIGDVYEDAAEVEVSEVTWFEGNH